MAIIRSRITPEQLQKMLAAQASRTTSGGTRGRQAHWRDRFDADIGVGTAVEDEDSPLFLNAVVLDVGSRIPVPGVQGGAKVPAIGSIRKRCAELTAKYGMTFQIFDETVRDDKNNVTGNVTVVRGVDDPSGIVPENVAETANA